MRDYRQIRTECLEDLPAVIEKAGFRILGRRSEAGVNYFDCRSAGGVDISLWVPPPDKEAFARLYWTEGRGFLRQAWALDTVSHLLLLLSVKGFLSDEEYGSKS